MAENEAFARNLFWALVGLSVPTLLQFAYLLVAARGLEVSQFGSFLLLISILMISVPLAGLGGGGVALKMVARDAMNARLYFGQALTLSGLTIPIIAPIVIVLGALLTKGNLPLWVIIAVVIVELIAYRLVQTCSAIFIGQNKQRRSSVMLISMTLARLLSALSMLAWPAADRLAAFSALYCAFVMLAGLACVFYTVMSIGPPVLTIRGYRYWDGFTFAATDLNSTLQTETEKVLLGLVGALGGVAVYTIAARLMDGAAMPPRALRMSIHSRLFQEGAKGHHGSLRLTMQMLPLIIAYGVLAWIGFLVAAPLIASLFGPGYEPLARLLPVLGVLPLVRAIADFGAEIFITSDRPGLQAFVQSCSTILRILAGLFLIMHFGLDGAVANTLAVTTLTAVVLWVLALRAKAPERA